MQSTAIHKEEMLNDVMHRFPARHDAVVDDELRILVAIKKAWGDRIITV